MKKFTCFVTVCLSLLLLSSCATRQQTYSSQVSNSLTQEHWMQQTNLNTSVWTRSASRWFFTGQPSQFDQFGAYAPSNAAITAMMVRVPCFNSIQIDAPVTVQIFGHQERDSVYVIGPNALARQVAVDVRGNMLSIHMAPGCKTVDHVIVRIGVNNLNQLIVNGAARVEGTDIYSSSLLLKATGEANVLLAGNINLRYVLQAGSGVVSVIGAYTPGLDIRDIGNGTVNVSGRVGVHSIVKSGCGEINIIGADSNALTIDSAGTGTTRIAGYANVKTITATQGSHVYLYWVNSNGIYVILHDQAVVGLAGTTDNINIEADGLSRFEGKCLNSGNTYVRTRHGSHANVSPVQKLFANAMDNSSIYFFSSPNVVSRYTLDNGIVVPVWREGSPRANVPPPSSWSWGHRARVPMKRQPCRTPYK